MNGSSWVASAGAWVDGPASWQPSGIRIPAGAVAASLAVDAAAAVSAIAIPADGHGLALRPETVGTAATAAGTAGPGKACWASGAGAITAHCLPATDTVDVPLGVRPWAVLTTTAPLADALGAALAPAAPEVRTAAVAAVAAAQCVFLSQAGSGLGRVTGAVATGGADLSSRQAGLAPVLAAQTRSATLVMLAATVAQPAGLLPCWRCVAPRLAGLETDVPATRSMSWASGIVRSSILAMPLDRALTRQAPVTTSIRFDAALAFERK